jgi:hypothetical protein
VHPGRFTAEGEGWRLAWEADRQPFAVLIGGADWATELTAAEALGLRAAVATLLEQHAAIADRLMAEEAIGLELEREGWWLGLEGDQLSWCLSFVLSPGSAGRAVEGGWGPAASAAFAAALARLPL